MHRVLTEWVDVQGGAVAQAIVLLEDCLDNVQLAGAALQSAHAAGTTAGCGDICSISQTVAEADSRAEEVSSLARCHTCFNAKAITLCRAAKSGFTHVSQVQVQWHQVAKHSCQMCRQHICFVS